ncbi:helix-turn-helix domain-containing protein [Bradyrhizobium liaoningense]
MKVISVELEHCQGFLPQWADALSTHVGELSPDSKLISCMPGSECFSGRIEIGDLDNARLSKISATPYRSSRSVRIPEHSVPAMLVAQVIGTCRIEQDKRSCTLQPGDWCVVDTPAPCNTWVLAPHNEFFTLALEPSSISERLRMLEIGAARRFSSQAGLSRLLLGTLTQTFDQMNRLSASSRKALQRALNEMAWGAVCEQLDAPLRATRLGAVCARVKGYIERHLANTSLSVASIADACGVSVRTIHRAFNTDPVGSVWHYIWMRRLSHCAAGLRDPRQAHRSITDICYSGGFNSTSHFSRLFKEHFGVTPREYRDPTQSALPPRAVVACLGEHAPVWDKNESSHAS